MFHPGAVPERQHGAIRAANAWGAPFWVHPKSRVSQTVLGTTLFDNLSRCIIQLGSSAAPKMLRRIRPRSGHASGPLAPPVQNDDLFPGSNPTNRTPRPFGSSSTQPLVHEELAIATLRLRLGELLLFWDGLMHLPD